MDKAKDSFSALVNIFNKLTMQQRLMLGGIAVVAVVLLIFILVAFNEPNYTTLYSNLAPEEASEVVNYLTSQKYNINLKTTEIQLVFLRLMFMKYGLHLPEKEFLQRE